MKLRYLILIAIAAILFLSADLNAQVRVVVEQPVVPVLIGKPYNPVLRLDFIKEKSCNAKVCQLQFSELRTWATVGSAACAFSALKMS